MLHVFTAIMIDRRGGMFVGKRAYEQDAFSPENVGREVRSDSWARRAPSSSRVPTGR